MTTVQMETMTVDKKTKSIENELIKMIHSEDQSYGFLTQENIRLGLTHPNYLIVQTLDRVTELVALSKFNKRGSSLWALSQDSRGIAMVRGTLAETIDSFNVDLKKEYLLPFVDGNNHHSMNYYGILAKSTQGRYGDAFIMGSGTFRMSVMTDDLRFVLEPFFAQMYIKNINIASEWLRTK